MDKNKIIEFIEENFRNRRKNLIPKIKAFFLDASLFSEIYKEFEQKIGILFRVDSYCSGTFKNNIGDASDIYTFYLNEDLIIEDKNDIDWDFKKYLESGKELHMCRVWVNWFLPVYYLETTYELINTRKKYEQYGDVHLSDENEIKVVETVKSILAQKGFTLLDDKDFLNQKIEGVSTDIASKNKATVFDCLFSDIIHPTPHRRKSLPKKSKMPQLSFLEYLDDNREVIKIEANIYHKIFSPITITFDKNHKIIETESRGKLNGKNHTTIKIKYG